MNISRQLRNFLHKQNIHFELIKHPSVYTSQEIAAVEHVPGREVAKAVMVKTKSEVIMVVVPASRQLDFLKLKQWFGEDDLRLAEEFEFAHLFSDCETGAIPGMGVVYGIRCLVDESLLDNRVIYLSAGTRSAGIKILINDYLRASDPEIGDFSVASLASMHE